MTRRTKATATVAPTETPALKPVLFVMGKLVAAGVGTTVVVGVVAVEGIVGLPELGKRVVVPGVASMEGDDKDVLVTLLLKAVYCDLMADVLVFVDAMELVLTVSLLLRELWLVAEQCPANAQDWPLTQHIDPHNPSPESASQTSVGDADAAELVLTVPLLLGELSLTAEHCPANAQYCSVAQHMDPHSSSPESMSHVSVGETVGYVLSPVGVESSSV